MRDQMKVILAAGDPAERAGWKAALAGAGAVEVVEAPDLATLLSGVAEGVEDSLLVLSWGFASLNASALVSAIRQRRRGPPPPILAVGGEGDRAAMEAAGFAGLLVRPVPPEELARKASLMLFGEETESRRVLREIVSTAEAELDL